MRNRILASLALAAAFSAPAARADTVTLASLLAGGDLTTGGFTYSNFSNYSGLVAQGNYAAVGPNDASQIFVTTTANGLTFTGGLASATNGSVQNGESFHFQITPTGPGGVGGGTISFNGTVGAADVANASPPLARVVDMANIDLVNPSTSTSLTSTVSRTYAAFGQPTLGMTVAFEAFSSATRGASVNTFTLSTVSVPEPSSLALAGLTAAAALAYRLRINRRA